MTQSFKPPVSPFDPLPAAQELVARRRAGTLGDRLPESDRPLNLDQALAVQNAVAELWCEREDDSIGAWKAGLPTDADATQAAKVVLAPIFTRTIDSVAPVSLWAFASKQTARTVARIEPELAFFLAKDLPARAEPYTPNEVAAAVGRVHLALELIGCRYAEPKSCAFPEILADSLVNQGLFIGPQVDKNLAFNARELVFNLVENGINQRILGTHPAGDPAAPLYWLAEYLRSQGQGLLAGQAVITGSYAGVLEVGLDSPLQLTYLSADEKIALGTLEVEFRARLAT